MDTTWQLEIGKGSTVRVPLTAFDENKKPFTLNSGTFTITPDDGTAPISCTQLNGKLTMSGSFAWKGVWSGGTTYNVDDVVRFSNDRYYRCLETVSGEQPPGSDKWQLFSQFTLVLSSGETAGYNWKTGKYKLGVVFSNGDVDLNYASGFVVVKP